MRSSVVVRVVLSTVPALTMSTYVWSQATASAELKVNVLPSALIGLTLPS